MTKTFLGFVSDFFVSFFVDHNSLVHGENLLGTGSAARAGAGDAVTQRQLSASARAGSRGVE